MSTFEILMVAGMTAVTFGVRYPVLVLVSRVRLPHAVMEALKFIPPAVLTAIIIPAMFMPAGSMDISISNAYLVAGIISALLAWRTRNLLATIVLGMVIFLGWQWLM